MSLTGPVATSSHRSKLSRPPLLTIHPTLQRPFGVQLARASSSRSGNASQRSLLRQTRASAFAIAAVIMSSVSSASGIAQGGTRVLVDEHDARAFATGADQGLAVIPPDVAAPLAGRTVK